MNKYVVFAALMLTFLLLFGWMNVIAFQSRSGPEVILSVKGYDPRDLLSGHYIRYQIDWEKSNCRQFANSRCPVQDFAESGRFYIPEDKAVALDRLFSSSDQHTFEIVYSYKPSSIPIAKKLLIDGQEWQKIVKEGS